MKIALMALIIMLTACDSTQADLLPNWQKVDMPCSTAQIVPLDSREGASQDVRLVVCKNGDVFENTNL